MDVISQHWGNLRPYTDAPMDAYGVSDTGLPYGCQVEQVQVLHRHGARYPAHVEFEPMAAFAEKVAAKNPAEKFRGPLAFLNRWSLQHGQELLLPNGVSMLHKSGTDFWNVYGRVLFNANVGQSFYEDTATVKPLIRANTAPRVLDSARAWAEGFFAQYNTTSKYRFLAIPIGLTSNNTLSSFTVCENFAVSNASISAIKVPFEEYAKFYLSKAKARLNRYTPESVHFNKVDIFAMQSMCAYDFIVFGSSDFCKLFTLAEWQGFEYNIDVFTYNTFSFGFPTGRATGIGTLQELVARLKGEFITVSHTSVNSTLASNSETFPLDQKFYADFTHEFIILSTLTAMSLDYFKRKLTYQYPPPLKRHFRMSVIAPFGAHLVTEKIGCNSPAPIPRKKPATHYTSGQYGYSESNSTYKFVRMRLNNGILPLKDIRGYYCDIPGRSDGLCPLQNFLDSQADAEQRANYGFVCFDDYTYNPDLFNYDGTYSG